MPIVVQLNNRLSGCFTQGRTSAKQTDNRLFGYPTPLDVLDRAVAVAGTAAIHHQLHWTFIKLINRMRPVKRQVVRMFNSRTYASETTAARCPDNRTFVWILNTIVRIHRIEPNAQAKPDLFHSLTLARNCSPVACANKTSRLKHARAYPAFTPEVCAGISSSLHLR